MFVLWWLLIIFIELFILMHTQNVILAGILIITFGLMFLSCYLKGFAANKRAVITMILYCFVWGGLLCVSPLVDTYTVWGDTYVMHVWTGGFGWMFLLLGIYMGVIQNIKCKEKIEAVYMGGQAYSGRGGVKQYSPQFSYSRNGRTFSNITGHTYSQRKLNKKFQVGNTYQIYMDPENPLTIREHKRIGSSSVLLMVMGVIVIGIPFWDL